MRGTSHSAFHRILLAPLLLALGSAFAPSVAAAPGAAPVRIMPLGDSITGSPDSRRAELWNRLRSAGRTSIDFVGTLSPQGCPQAFDGDNEGHGGELVTNVAHQNLLPAHLSATRSDIVVTHLGTNDLWSNIAPDRILTADRSPVTRMRASYPAMRILVAKILPMNPTNCPDRARRAVDLDGRIRGWARAISTRRSPVRVVDQRTGFSTPHDTCDGVHPSTSGNTKIAARWHPPPAALL
jgi:lysophospholipase L1-like esterase